MIRRWIARLLGIKQHTGLSITVPEGAVLILPAGATIDSVYVAGGTVANHYTPVRCPLASSGGEENVFVELESSNGQSQTPGGLRDGC